MNIESNVITNILGMIASIISFVMWLPQAISTWKHRNNPTELAGISKGTQYFVLVNATIWGVYGVLSNAYWTGAPGLVNFPLALMTLYLIYRGSKLTNTDSAQPCGCGWEGSAHVFLVTSPPGYGTIRECFGNLRHGFPIPAGSTFNRTTGTLVLPDMENISKN